MSRYRLSGQEFHFSTPVLKLAPFEITVKKPGTADEAVSFVPYLFLQQELISQTAGWVANAQRSVELWSAPSGFLMRVSGGRDFYISSDGQAIQLSGAEPKNEVMSDTPKEARKLAVRLRGLICHVNAIPLNPTHGYKGQATTHERAHRFKELLEQAGIPCTIRMRRGIDIQAGCGQLAYSV